MARAIGKALLILGMAALAPLKAEAHPHMWVDMLSDIVFDDQGMITGVNVDWTFDDGYAQMAMEGLDVNGDGIYSADELEPLTKENLESLKDYDYFTVMRLAGKKLEIGPATDAGQIFSNNKLKLHFFVPLKQPVDPKSGEFQLKVYDPDFFISFDYMAKDPVSVIGKIPANCALNVKPVPTDAELEQTRLMLSTKGTDWKPENDEDFGALFAQPALIQCKP